VVDPLARVLGVVPLSPAQWALVAGLGLVPGVVGQVVKAAR